MIITENKIKVLSLFDGMSCGMIAMTESNFEIDRYVAYEIDEYAIQTSKFNFPEIEQRGDVFEADFTEFEGFDYLIGGSPCTYWSIAQKNGREVEASGLGWELFKQYSRALNEAKPKYFIYENNKSMSTAIKDSISNTFGFDPICINSALVSAQNRNRLYWVGQRNEMGEYKRVNIKQPEDRGILIRDIIDHISEPVNILSNGKARCLTASYTNKGAKHILESFYSDNSNKQKWDCVAVPINLSADGTKARTLKAQYYKNGLANFITNGGFEVTAVAEPIEFLNNIPIKAISSADGKTYKVYRVKNKKNIIKGKEYPIELKDGYYIIRKLTVTECMRLQTVPEWYKFPVSSSRAYKLLGNGWTIEVIKWLLKYTYED